MKTWFYHIYRALATIIYRSNTTENAPRVPKATQKHLSRLAVALTDFQKAQCIFMLATNVAAQVVIRRGGLQPQNLGQLYNTYVFIKVLAISGFLPVTFTLYNLHLIEMVSWYLLILSTSSVALSAVTLLTLGESPTQANLADLDNYYSSGGPESCGNVRPDAYCSAGEDLDWYDLDLSGAGYGASQMLAFCVVLILLLVVEKSGFMKSVRVQRMARWLAEKSGFCLATLTLLSKCIVKTWDHPVIQNSLHFARYFRLSFQAYLSDVAKFLYRRISLQPVLLCYAEILNASWATQIALERWIICRNSSRIFWRLTVNRILSQGCFETSVQFVIITIHFIITGLYLYSFVLFSRALVSFAGNDIYSKTWNFGQVVAITVWAPPLFEYIHLELRKSSLSFLISLHEISWIQITHADSVDCQGGMRRGFEHKLLPPYRLTRMKDLEGGDPEGKNLEAISEDVSPLNQTERNDCG